MKNGKNLRSKISRRQFMAGTAAAAAFTFLPRHVLGGAGTPPPSEKLNIAAIGAGGRAIANIMGCADENIIALCDVDDQRAAEMFNKYPKAAKYKDFRKMLEKEKSIDAVIVATPDHTHAVAAMMAMKMGKHVYCEKPLTHSVYEARVLAETARQTKVATQMGNQGFCGEGIRLLCEWVWDGAIGNVREAHVWTDRPLWPQGIDRPTDTPPVPSNIDWDLWLGPAPYRPYNPIYAPFSWRGWWDFGTGAIGDMACHLIDGPFYALKLGHPTSIEACSTKVYSETAPAASVVYYEFPARGDMPPVKVVWYDGGLKPQRPAELEEGRKLGDDSNGVLLIGDKGKIMAGVYCSSPRLIPESAMQAYKRPEKTLPRTNGPHADWIEACKTGKKACSNFEVAGPITEAALLGCVAIRARQKLYWDGPNMKVTNVPEANAYLRRDYRQGWSL